MRCDRCFAAEHAIASARLEGKKFDNDMHHLLAMVSHDLVDVNDAVKLIIELEKS